MTFDEWFRYFGKKSNEELIVNLDRAIDIFKQDRDSLVWLSSLLATELLEIIEAADSDIANLAAKIITDA